MTYNLIFSTIEKFKSVKNVASPPSIRKGTRQFLQQQHRGHIQGSWALLNEELVYHENLKLP